MSRFDVLVVGSGPAGACAALRLSRAGLQVALLEKETLPRFKPCGGIVPRVVFRHLADLDPSLGEPTAADLEMESIRYSYKGGSEASTPLPEGKALSMERRDFDLRIVQAAQAAGARVMDGVGVGSLSEDPEGVRVVTSTGARLEADHLVGADGGNSLVAARLGLRRGREPLAVAAEVQVPGQGAPEGRGGRAHLDFGFVRNGYIGTVEKRGFLTVGLYVLGKPPAGGVKPLMDDWIERYGLPRHLSLHTRSFPVYRSGRDLHTKRCVVAGDAAGLVDPLSGEGIRHAVRSGTFAAEAILAAREGTGTLADYSRRVHEVLGPELVLAGSLAWVAYRFPSIALQGMKRVSTEATLVINGEMSYRDLLNRLVARIWRKTGLRPGK